MTSFAITGTFTDLMENDLASVTDALEVLYDLWGDVGTLAVEDWTSEKLADGTIVLRNRDRKLEINFSNLSCKTVRDS